MGTSRRVADKPEIMRCHYLQYTYRRHFLSHTYASSRGGNGRPVRGPTVRPGAERPATHAQGNHQRAKWVGIFPARSEQNHPDSRHKHQS